MSRGKVHAITPIEPTLRNAFREDWPLCGIAPWQGAMTKEAASVTCKTCLRLLGGAARDPGGET